MQKEGVALDTKNYDGKEYVDATNANGSYSASQVISPHLEVTAIPGNIREIRILTMIQIA